jgi:hypothetical protein
MKRQHAFCFLQLSATSPPAGTTLKAESPLRKAESRAVDLPRPPCQVTTLFETINNLFFHFPLFLKNK